ncbi:hypothetical protein V1498_05615 [Peribacillus sp. SCS-26]|uniref:hypothetical protein n=1 Tax=Paraperibacillus marinus TaxID=3115295 RepID=UPI003906AE19
MNNHPERQQIFEEELQQLEKRGYISPSIGKLVRNGYQEYIHTRVDVPEAAEPLPSSPALPETPDVQRPVTVPKPAVRKPKKVLSAEEIRERNITAMLVIGVLLFLLGGLVLATNSWDQMTPLLKTISIGFVSLLFYGLSWLSKHKLKIEKTGFAFLALGSMFIPITIICAGYFKLFGEWFSLHGGGNYLYLAAGLGLIVPVYFRHALTENSRLFVWIGYVLTSMSVSFLIAAAKPSKDLFYAGVLLFNAVLLAVHHVYKGKKNIFTKDLPLYAQGNLALSTIALITIFYSDSAQFGFNLVATSLLYLFVLFSTKQKGNHFAFSAALLYGLYMLIENTALRAIDLAVFSAAGFLFIAIGSRKKEYENLFQYTSALVSLLSFIFVTGKALLMNSGGPSGLLALSYLLLALNYGYLNLVLKQKAFSYAAVAFMVLSGYQVVRLIDSAVSYELEPAGIFAVGLVLINLLHFRNQSRFLAGLKIPGAVIPLAVMVFGTLLAALSGAWFELMGSLLILSWVLYKLPFSFPGTARIIWLYSSASAFYLSLMTGYQLLKDSFPNYGTEAGIAGHAAIVSLLFIPISSFFERKGNGEYARTLDWLGTGVYTAMITVVLGEWTMDADIMLPLFFAIGCVIYARMAGRMNMPLFWSAGAVSFSAAYNAFLMGTLDLSGRYVILLSTLGVLVLLALARAFKEHVMSTQLFLTAQGYTGILLLVSVILYLDNPLIIIILAAFVFYSFTEWKNRAVKWGYLYLSITAIPLSLYSGELYLYGPAADPVDIRLETQLILLVSGVIIGLLWKNVKEWKNEILYYLIPFIILSMVASVLFGEEEGLYSVILHMLLLCFSIYIFTSSRLTSLNLIPLGLSVAVVEEVDFLYFDAPIQVVLVYIALFFASKIMGERLFKNLVQQEEPIFHSRVDAFSFASLLFIAVLYGYEYELSRYGIAVKMIPGILLVYWLFSQIKRVPAGIIRRVVQTLSYGSLVIPYYTLTTSLDLPPLWEAEIYCLPWIVLTVFFSKKTWSSEKRVMGIIQWVVLILASGVLMTDALLSHTLYDAFIMGSLSLIAILAGFHYKIKSYFLVGSFVLLLNVLIQSKPYWGNMPWWAYLILSGSILIGAGSYHEWKKGKGPVPEEKMLKNKVKKIWNDWN